ncbi:hypothetical protein AB0F81_23630 [Actinoplanes sp. NPDC024001]|uniref:hypothetical protein n=1 Tax=Actinoplanes sp. NPDC024001 TaxID=3154598 RepID=UPI0033D2F542
MTARLDVVAGAPADLMTTIRDLRERADAYLRSACSRRRLLTNVTVVGSALATMLTAAPAFGGKPFAAWLTGTFGLSSPAWQLLCAAAAVCSLATTIAGQLLKSDGLDDRVATAQTVRVRLEALEIRAGLRQIDQAEAVAELAKCVEDAALVWPSTPRPPRATGRATVYPLR